MAEIRFTIQDANIPRIISAFNGTWSIPLDAANNPQFTDAGWVKECLRQYIIQVIRNYEENQARNAVSVNDDLIQ